MEIVEKWRKFRNYQKKSFLVKWKKSSKRKGTYHKRIEDKIFRIRRETTQIKYQKFPGIIENKRKNIKWAFKQLKNKIIKIKFTR